MNKQGMVDAVHEKLGNQGSGRRSCEHDDQRHYRNTEEGRRGFYRRSWYLFNKRIEQHDRHETLEQANQLAFQLCEFRSSEQQRRLRMR